MVTTTTFEEPLVGKLSFGATLGGAYNGTVSVTLHCVPTPQAMLQWRTDVYGMLANAVLARQREIAAAKLANRSMTDDRVHSAISPTVRASLIRDELKRQLIDCLLGEHFEGFKDAPDGYDNNNVARPMMAFDQARLHGVMVRFFEQSFEWDNLMHVLYPAYWASSENWQRRVDFESSDLDLTTFLEAGGARVLVPARPGFESAVFTFLELGLILDGSATIGGSGAASLSVAEEIMSLTRPPADGEPGESWEATVPTALLWLDTSLDLPIENQANTLTKP